MDGPNKCAGRVEVLHENRWGSVCDDHWDMEDAKVVCKQVGCGSPLSALGGARYGRGPDVIWLDDVNCTGTEESIFDCQARPWGQHDCYHGEDADVVCAGKPPITVTPELIWGQGQAVLAKPAGWTGWDKREITRQEGSCSQENAVGGREMSEAGSPKEYGTSD